MIMWIVIRIILLLGFAWIIFRPCLYLFGWGYLRLGFWLSCLEGESSELGDLYLDIRGVIREPVDRYKEGGGFYVVGYEVYYSEAPDSSLVRSGFTNRRMFIRRSRFYDDFIDFVESGDSIIKPWGSRELIAIKADGRFRKTEWLTCEF